ncbi:MAG: SDR family NAD(P)-dependent oxidoreductase, partial [Desulfobacterales bacterium]|nr:SDR family NAD(P)-dependent oxidoreductase [Desulfobacterales bacterium]
LEAASGVAGVIKMVLSLVHREIPPHLHFKNPSPDIPWDRLPAVIPAERTPWPRGRGERIAGVSSFGFSGTNAHVILAEAPRPPAEDHGALPEVHALPLSAQTDAALKALAVRYEKHLSRHPDPPPGAICFTAGVGRAHFKHRAAVLGASTRELKEKLADFTAGRPAPGVYTGNGEETGSAEPRTEILLSNPGRLGKRYAEGADIDWARLYKGIPLHRAPLPTYPFQRRRYWVKPAPAHAGGRSAPRLIAGGDEPHPLLGGRLSSASGEIQFHARVSGKTPSFLADHQVFEALVLPASAYLEMALAAGSAVFKSGPPVVEEVDFLKALVLRKEEETAVQLILTPDETGAYRFKIFSLVDPGEEEETWALHARGSIRMKEGPAGPLPADPDALQTRDFQEKSVRAHYRECLERGIRFGPRFQGVRGLWSREGEALGRVRLPGGGDARDFQFHPALMDACMQVLGAISSDRVDGKEVHLPVSLSRLTVHQRPDAELWCRASLRPMDASENPLGFVIDLDLFTGEGRPAARLEGLQLKKTDMEALSNQARPSWSDWLHEVKWRPRARRDRSRGADFFPAPREIHDALLPRLEALEDKTGLAGYWDALDRLENLSAAFATRALEEMGFSFTPGRRLPAGALGDELGVAPRHRRLLDRIVEMLVEENLLKREGRDLVVVRPPGDRDPRTRARALKERRPEAGAEITLLERCGGALAPVLRGERDPLPLLFSEENEITAAALYQESPGARIMNTLLGLAVSRALESLPPHRELRVLEIGAGTGGSTAHILPRLPEGRVRYCFTDVSPLFLNQARDRFRERPFMEFKTLDIEQSPEGQGFQPRQHHLVIAANVLHATRDLRQTAQNAARLLAPGGVLALMEGVAPVRFIDLIFGLTEGWWRFDDHDLRPAHPLLPAPRWRTLLKKSGFQRAETVGGDREGGGIFSRQAVILAATPGAAPAGEERRPGAWLILADAGGVGEKLAALPGPGGASPILVRPGKKFTGSADVDFTVDPTNPDHFRRLVKAADAPGRPLRGVVHLWSLDLAAGDAGELAKASRMGCGAALHLVQALVSMEREDKRAAALPGLWLVTRGAQPAGEEADAPNPIQAPLWGMGKSITLEHPDLPLALVDLAPGKTGARALSEEIRAFARSHARENQIALRGPIRLVPRLTPHAGPAPPRRDLVRGDASYLITGGLRGLGLLTAEWLARRGACHLTLVGRSAPGPDAENRLDRMERDGVRIRAARADVSREAELAGVLKKMEASSPPLRGIIHSAGVLDDGVLMKQSPGRFRRVMAPKVDGAWFLHMLTRGAPLDFFVMYSSTASLLGSPGQANHGAANAFLDALAHHRRARGLPALSVNWGAWSHAGAAARRGVDQRVKRKGMGAISPARGVEILERLMSGARPRVGVAPIHWPVFLQQFSAGPPPRFLSERIRGEKQEKRRSRGRTDSADLSRSLDGASGPERRALLTAHLRERTAAVLRLDPDQTDERLPLNKMGLDSLMAVELRNSIRKTLGPDIPMVKFLEGLSIADLVLEVEKRLAPAGEKSREKRQTPRSAREITPDEAAELLANLDQLSDEEVEALLK